MPGAADLEALPEIDPDELAWLATLDDVESRLVLTELRDGAPFYRVETGPFAEQELEALPGQDWTLLIQDAEKHLPELRAYFDLLPFIPDWRIDDLMISVAAPGGSVGPHVDNYDVFLLQTRGHREWQWTEGELRVDRGASDQLRLVEPLTQAERRVAEAGDVLYLNPGVGHHGIATDLCVTCSIGMRAPQLSELAGRAIEGDDAFYTDADLGVDEAKPGYISGRAIERAAALLSRHGLDGDAAESLLGRFATMPKEWLAPEAPVGPRPDASTIRMHGMAQLAWSDRRVFANGREWRLPEGGRELLSDLAATRSIPPDAGGRWLGSPALAQLLDELWDAAVFDFPGENPAGT